MPFLAILQPAVLAHDAFASSVLRDDFGSMSIFGYLVVHLLIVQLVSTVRIPSQ